MNGRVVMTIALLLTLSSTTSTFAADKTGNVLVDMFAWWNETMKVPGGFTGQGFSQFFTDDASIVVNNTEVVRGVDNMVAHFHDIQDNTEYVEIVLPFEEEFREGNKIFTHHLIRASDNGVARLSHIMGYAVIEDGKIALVNFLNYTEQAEQAAP